MATESTKDALIDLNGVPASEQPNLTTTQGPNGTIVNNSGTVRGLTAFVPGRTEFTGGRFDRSTFNFSGTQGSNPFIGARNTEVVNSNFNGTNSNDGLGFGGNNPLAKSSARTSVINANASLGAGQDSVSFSKRSQDLKSSYDMGQGQDSVTFGKGSFSKKTSVSLGRRDGAADIVDVANQSVVKKFKINDFGVNDTLRVGSKTYDYADLQAKDGKMGNIKVSFD